MFPYEFIACPRCGSQMYPAVTEALPGGINKTVFSCDDCHAETERAFQSVPTRTAAWPVTVPPGILVGADEVIE